MKYIQKMSLVLLIGFCACEEGDTRIPLDINTASRFIGVFETTNSDDVYGDVTLSINKSSYECETSLPFGQGAGTLLVDDQTINFVDTLFFAIPAIYGPSYTLSGEHEYSFDGQKLTIWKSKNEGEIHYELQIEN